MAVKTELKIATEDEDIQEREREREDTYQAAVDRIGNRVFVGSERKRNQIDTNIIVSIRALLSIK